MPDPLRFPAPPVPGPARRGAFAGQLDKAAEAVEDLALREVDFPALLVVRGDGRDESLHAAVRGAVEVDLPQQPNTVARTDGGISILWLGPKEWLIVGPTGQEEALYRTILEKLPRGAALTDVTDSLVVLELSGPRAGELLAKGCPLDLHPEAFPPGSCGRTLYGQVPVVVEATAEHGTFRLYVRPSVARFVTSWLLDAAAEYG